MALILITLTEITEIFKNKEYAQAVMKAFIYILRNILQTWISFWTAPVY